MLLKDKRIYIVEDQTANRSIAQLMLEREGAKIFFERWGINTLHQIADAMPIDIILMDLMLPDKVTGYDIFQQIRADTSLCHIPVVAVSAADPEAALHKTKKLGFNGFIRKPINILHFARQIAAVLDGETLWQTH